MRQGESIKIAELVSPDAPNLADETFQDCDILGPAILGPIEAVMFGDCRFAGSNADAVLIEAPDRPITGVIGLYRVHFLRWIPRGARRIGCRDADAR